MDLLHDGDGNAVVEVDGVFDALPVAHCLFGHVARQSADDCTCDHSGEASAAAPDLGTGNGASRDAGTRSRRSADARYIAGRQEGE